MPAEHLKRGTLSRRGGSPIRTADESIDDLLARSPMNLERLLRACEAVDAGRGRIMTVEELRREIGLGPA